MAVDIMAHPVRFLTNKLLIALLILGFWGCQAPETTVPITYKTLQIEDNTLTMLNGILLENNIPFSGSLYTLYPGTTDTTEITSYKNGKEHGEWRKFYPSKKLQEKRYFENGQKTGIYMAWWENGQQQLEYNFVAGEYEGTCKEWNEAGMLSKIMNYSKGHEVGTQQWWYDNGKIKANYIIKNGRRYGLLGTKNCINVSDSIFKN